MDAPRVGQSKDVRWSRKLAELPSLHACGACKGGLAYSSIIQHSYNWPSICLRSTFNALPFALVRGPYLSCCSCSGCLPAWKAPQQAAPPCARSSALFHRPAALTTKPQVCVRPLLHACVVCVASPRCPPLFLAAWFPCVELRREISSLLAFAQPCGSVALCCCACLPCPVSWSYVRPCSFSSFSSSSLPSPPFPSSSRESRCRNVRFARTEGRGKGEGSTYASYHLLPFLLCPLPSVLPPLACLPLPQPNLFVRELTDKDPASPLVGEVIRPRKKQTNMQ
jgi:hypothetical protein